MIDMAPLLSTYETPNIEINTIKIKKISTMRTEISRIIKKTRAQEYTGSQVKMCVNNHRRDSD